MTFLEMTISIVIFTIIVASIFTTIYTGRLYWRVGTAQLDVQQEAREGLADMAKELRQSRAGTGRVGGGTPVAILKGVPADDNWYNSVTFRIPMDTNGDGNVLNSSGQIVDWSEEITYCRNTSTNQIIRLWQNTSPCSCSTPYTNCRVLANNTYNLEFKRASGAPNLIQMRVTTRKNIEGTTEPIEYVVRTWARLKN
jgi:type II secretory pathway pseudopilin PulG